MTLNQSRQGDASVVCLHVYPPGMLLTCNSHTAAAGMHAALKRDRQCDEPNELDLAIKVVLRVSIRPVMTLY